MADNIIVGDAGANLTNAISAYTDTVTIRGNLLNFTPRWPVNPVSVNGVYTLTVPDIVDAVSISQASAPVASIVTAQAAEVAGQITFVKMVNTGLAYSSATVSFSGTGTGAAATAWVSNGQVIGIQMTSFGSGYGPGTTVTITGNGSGATATVQVGLPVWQNRELTIDCLAATSFAVAGSCAGDDQLDRRAHHHPSRGQHRLDRPEWRLACRAVHAERLCFPERRWQHDAAHPFGRFVAAPGRHGRGAASLGYGIDRGGGAHRPRLSA